MQSRKLKYHELLCRFTNCPPDIYKDIDIDSFRWVFKDNLLKSFIPLNLIKEPPQRMLDETDNLCKGYGLSFFNSFENCYGRYKSFYKKKRNLSHLDFISEKGNSIAELNLDENEGIYGDLNTLNGHYTFHEFEEINLSEKIVNIVEIFDGNGNFNR